MPSFYEFGGVMLTPEAIANRKGAAKGNTLVFPTKSSLVDAVVELRSSIGETTTGAQVNRFISMRRDQLEELHGVLLRKRPKEAKIKKEIIEKKEVVITSEDKVEQPIITKPTKK